MINKIETILTGQVKVTGDSIILKSTGIGSCVVVVAFDAGKQVGGMAHIMLPGAAPQNAKNKNNYAFNAISQLFHEMLSAGVDRDDIEVCLVGAGNVLKKHDDTICGANIDSVTRILKDYCIPIKATVLGGVQRKSVSLDIKTGIISYTEGDGQETLLWQAEIKEKVVI